MNWSLLLDGLIVLSAAMVFGAVAERLKQSAMVGFMLAGLVIGPQALGLIGEQRGDNIISIASLGVTLLMFSIGLEFSWSKLKRLGLTALAAGGLQIALTCLAGVGVVAALGVSVPAAFAISLAVAMSSTGVVMPALAANGAVDSSHGRFALGILLVQDAAVVPAILIVTALGGGGSPETIALEIVQSFGIVVAFVAVSALFVAYALPPMVAFIGPARNREMPVIFAIVASMGAAWAANELGLSPALGAFIAAVFLGESVIATQLRSDMGPLRIVFVTLFFASIGMLAQPLWIVSNLPLVAAATALVVGGKPVVVYLVGKAFGLTHRSAAAAGVCMGQVGVFSFVLAQIAADPQTGVFGERRETLFNLLVSVAIVTLFLTPYLVRLAPAAGFAWERWLRRFGVRATADAGGGAGEALAGHVVVVGYGPAGRAVADRAYTSGSSVVVLDLNPASVMAARKAGMRAYVGDASSPEVLTFVDVADAEALVVALPDHRLCVAITVEAKQQCPDLRVIARARYHRYVGLLEAAGADVVVDEERFAGDHLATALGRDTRAEAGGPTGS